MDDLASIREPRAMMTTIARHIMIELFRRNKLRKAYEAELAALPVTSVASPEHQMIILEALRAIDEVLSTMSSKARRAFLMSQIDGMKYADIAREVGVSVSMVRKYIAQGLLRFYQYHPDRE
jgi:RNA polymerase sigma-70 factor (ECF subfamily)